jgi:hypothetical protein
MNGNDPDVSDPDGIGPDPDQPAASALVILRTPPAGTDAPLGVGLPPDRKRAERVQAHLRSLGFDVGALIGTSFSISAPAGVFRRSFGQEPLTAPPDRADDDGPRDLPIDRLPGDAAAAIEAIVFTPPPDYGPAAP